MSNQQVIQDTAVQEPICNSYKRNPDPSGPELIPCQSKPLRTITWQDVTGDCISGSYCCHHAVGLRRDEARGELLILADEPLEEIVLIQA